MSYRCDPVVSIQSRAAADAVAGHLAWAVLIDPGHVLTPGPVSWLADDTVMVEVLLASAQTSGGGLTERIAVDRAEVHGVRDREDTTFGLLTLAHPARHLPNAGRPFRSEALIDGLAAGQDTWSVLEQLGAVPAGVRSRPVDAVLGPVAQWEREKRADLVRLRLVDTVAVGGIRWCCLVKLCTNCGDCPEPWW